MTKPKAKATPETRTCDKCGNPFQAAKTWQRFCSLRCRMNNASADRYAGSKKAVRAIVLSLDDLGEVEGELTGTALETVQRVMRRLRQHVPATASD